MYEHLVTVMREGQPVRVTCYVLCHVIARPLDMQNGVIGVK